MNKSYGKTNSLLVFRNFQSGTYEGQFFREKNVEVAIEEVIGEAAPESYKQLFLIQIVIEP